MQRVIILILICLVFIQSPAEAFLLQKKDYKQNFLQEALNAEKRNNHDSAFHLYEKAMYYYGKDKNVVEAYAKFCERQQYFDKAEKLYDKLYILTKNKQYLFRKDLSSIKNGKLSNEKLHNLTENKRFNQIQLNQLNTALIYHYSYKEDWGNVKKTCDKISKVSIGKDTIKTCIVASEKTGGGKNAIGYYIRFSDLYPKDSESVNKILSLGEKYNDYSLQEKYIKKLSAQNPKNMGILYRLAGLHEKYGHYDKALSVYNRLIGLGDTSEHVKKSKAYDISVLHGKTQGHAQETVKYIPKPLSGFKLQEKLFYEALDAKNYPKAQPYLNKMLKSQPQNIKLLRHQVDIFFAQNNYKDAITFLEKVQKINPLSQEDEKFLAFLYSKTENYAKASEIIDNLIQKSPKNKDLLNPALEYSMAQKNWDKAIVYTDKMLEFEPNSEELLKKKGDLYSINKDFPNAIKSYESLIANYPEPEYYFTLSNFYMANQDFINAERIIKPLYEATPNVLEVVEAYLNSLLAQQKIRQAYWVIKNNHLENTKAGYMVMGDIAMTDKDYYTAASNYRNAVSLDPQDLVMQNKLAESYRMLGYINTPTKIYNNILVNDPENLQAKVGLGYLEIDKKNFDKSREIFGSVLKENPNYKPAQMAVAHSFIANDEKMTALNVIDKIEPDDETKLIKAQAYYDMRMWSDSKKALKGVATKDAEALKYKIRRDEAITITPTYSFFFQQLADEFKLDYHKFGINVSKNIEDNRNVFMEYNVIVYSSGGIRQLNNVMNEFKGGVQSRPNKKWEYRADLGVRAFEFGDGAMLVTDSWIKHYFSDKLNLKLGVKRINLEQSYLSAVGGPVNGVFTGRTADNKFYIDIQRKLPHQFYAYAVGAYGVVTAQNLNTNQYFEGLVGAGRLLYNNPRNKWINTFSADVISYNAAYQYNLLKIYSNTGQLFGGYFSPSYFNATTLNLKAEGNIKQWRLKYGVKGFGGIQNAISPDQTTPTWGFSPYVSYDLNDNVSINALYSHFTYADLVRDQFMINAVIRGFKKHAKN